MLRGKLHSKKKEHKKIVDHKKYTYKNDLLNKIQTIESRDPKE